MSISVVLRAVAETEFDEAFDYYESQREGLGPKFALHVQKTLDSLAAHPRMHEIVLGDIRKAVMRRFPFCIYYRTHDDRIEVIAVFHTSRDPSGWHDRV